MSDQPQTTMERIAELERKVDLILRALEATMAIIRETRDGV
jgi:hypothetical protein